MNDDDFDWKEHCYRMESMNRLLSRDLATATMLLQRLYDDGVTMPLDLYAKIEAFLNRGW